MSSALVYAIIALGCYARFGNASSAHYNTSMQLAQNETVPGSIFQPYCQAGYYCPPASEDSLPCPLGTFCTQGVKYPSPCNVSALLESPILIGGRFNASVGVKIYGTPLAGNYCNVSTFAANTLCPPGYYCPTPSEIFICPEGSYCEAASLKPHKCAPLSRCPAGSARTVVNVGAALAVIVAFLAFLLGYAVITNTSKAHNEKYSRHYAALERTAALFAQLTMDHTFARPSSRPLTALMEIRPRVTIACKDLSLTLPNGTCLLQNVSATFNHSSLFAIMGPSGSGKTSFLSAFRGIARAYGIVTGDILINGKQVNLSHYSDICTFVPQDDIVHENLTVRENLTFNARLRLSTSVSKRARALIVDEVIGLLGLGVVQHLLVGKAGQGGISGGQRKRVSIGIELVTCPSFSLQDEPTSGLDASTSAELLVAYKRLSKAGMNIVCVIHQPRYSAYLLFDEVLLLGRGGVTVYQGPTSRVLGYFSSLGYEKTPNENGADFVLDILAGSIVNTSDSTMVPSKLAEAWRDKGHLFLISPVDSAAAAAAAASTPLEEFEDMSARVGSNEAVCLARAYFSKHGIGESEVLTEQRISGFLANAGLPHGTAVVQDCLEILKTSSGNNLVTVETLCTFLARGTAQDLRAIGPLRTLRTSFRLESSMTSRASKGGLPASGSKPHRRSRNLPNFVTTYIVLCHKALIKQARNWRSAAVFILLIIVSAAIVGYYVGMNVNTIPIFLQDVDFGVDYLLPMLVFSLVTGVASVRIFGEDRDIAIRETQSGQSTLLFFLATCTTHMIDILLLPLIFLGIFALFAKLGAPFASYYAVLIGVSWWSSGIGYICSIAFSEKNATIACAAFILVWNYYIAGVGYVVFRDAGSFGKVLTGLSFSRWGVEALLVTSFTGMEPAYHPASHYYLANIGFCGTSDYPLSIDSPGAGDAIAAPLDALNVDIICQGYVTQDAIALFVLGFVFRVLVFFILWITLRPETLNRWLSCSSCFAWAHRGLTGDEQRCAPCRS